MRFLSAFAFTPLLLASLAGCATQRQAVVPTAPESPPAAEPARATPAPAGSSAAAHDKALPFLEDDFNRALAEARERKIPIFIDAWAPW